MFRILLDKQYIFFSEGIFLYEYDSVFCVGMFVLRSAHCGSLCLIWVLEGVWAVV